MCNNAKNYAPVSKKKKKKNGRKIILVRRFLLLYKRQHASAPVAETSPDPGRTQGEVLRVTPSPRNIRAIVKNELPALYI